MNTRKSTLAILATALFASTASAQDNENSCKPIYDGVTNNTQVTDTDLSACEDSFHDRVKSYVLKFGKYKETKSMLNLAECGRFGPLGDPNALLSIFKIIYIQNTSRTSC